MIDLKQQQKIPYMAIIGEKEVEDATVSLRTKKENLGTRTIAALKEQLLNESNQDA